MNRLFVMFFLTSFLVTACANQATPPSETSPISGGDATRSKRSVIIDTDMALDDWIAILYVLQHPDVEVIAITVTGTGEAHCGPGVAHALELVYLAGEAGIPVTCGRAPFGG